MAITFLLAEFRNVPARTGRSPEIPALFDQKEWTNVNVGAFDNSWKPRFTLRLSNG
jgi:hypothetical protein